MLNGWMILDDRLWACENVFCCVVFIGFHKSNIFALLRLYHISQKYRNDNTTPRDTRSMWNRDDNSWWWWSSCPCEYNSDLQNQAQTSTSTRPIDRCGTRAGISIQVRRSAWTHWSTTLVPDDPVLRHLHSILSGIIHGCYTRQRLDGNLRSSIWLCLATASSGYFLLPVQTTYCLYNQNNY